MIAAGRHNLPSGVCAGEAQTGTPPPEREIRKVRTVFDGGYYFDNMPPGEYIVAAGERWRRVHIAENEIYIADLITD